ncbi:hypothetical protein GCM10027403_12410 [Arthrobacter tecti]
MVLGFSNQRRTKALILPVALALLLAFIWPFSDSGGRAQSTTDDNLVANAPVTASSSWSQGRPPLAVDGDRGTSWQPLSGDREDGEVWITADLGDRSIFDAADIVFDTEPSMVESYSLLTSDDQENWTVAYDKTGPVAQEEKVSFDLASGRYYRIVFEVNDPAGVIRVAELGLYNGSGQPQPEVLRGVAFVDETGTPYDQWGTIDVSVDESVQLQLEGTTSEGQPADLSGATYTFNTSKPDIIRVEEDTRITGLSSGITQLTAEVTLDGATRSAVVFVDVSDPSVLVADLKLEHPTLAQEIGTPAILAEGEAVPALNVNPLVDVTVSAELANLSTGQTVGGFQESQIAAGENEQFILTDEPAAQGTYELRVQVTADGTDRQDVFAFTAVKEGREFTGQSKAAFLGKDGKLLETPDFKGNRMLDFSDAGYGGGGVALPNTQTRVRVEPGDGDDSARIQAAIDEVSQLPQNADGIRGAVLLTAGTYQVAETLLIDSSGIVLRGEGQGEDGTVLFATGTKVRNVLEVEGTAGVRPQAETTEVTDLYVPVGSRSFHVAQPAQFSVGDKVIVSRVGNDRWIHEIDMDTIVPRPGNPGATRQFEPTNLDFDRVITGIDGNKIIVDAPIANAIEQRWGGAIMTRYDDPERIENVGVENLRIDIEIDESKTQTVTQNGEQVTYYTDSAHAQNAVWIDNAKNVWIRDVTGLRSSNALVWVNTGAKWVTIQDTTSIEQAGPVASARSPYNLNGQLTLVQRSTADGSRHSFIVQAWVPGPNVFLDSVATRELNTSEPHQRWSVGGLFDNVTTDLAIQDRAWLGSGHGWSGANYVAWNTEGTLVVQRPPTATNYAIGHVGDKREAFVPNSDDPRPRMDAYWESFGAHVEPGSLYKQQMIDRLGQQGLDNIEKLPYGGGSLDDPIVATELPLLSQVKIDGKFLTNFDPNTFDYVIELPESAMITPIVKPRDRRHIVKVVEADSMQGRTVLISTDRRDPDKSVRYNFVFVEG